MTTTTTPITIDVYADVVCPWCYIGVRRLEQALATHAGTRVERRWRPFQLRPEMPSKGEAWQAFVAEKLGGEDRAAAAFEHVTELGHHDGIDFRFDLVTRAPNTADAHRLVLFARAQGREWAVADALLRAYFSEGRDLNDRDDLLAVAAGAGLDTTEVDALLAGDEHVDDVLESQRIAKRLGVTGVPFYVIDDRYGVSGAQPVETFERVLERVGAERSEPAA